MGAAAKTSQQVIDGFWKSYITPTNPPTKASAVLPRNVYAEMVKEQVPNGATRAEKVETTYLEAKKACEAKVAQIVKECTQINQKYSDPYFDLDDPYDCLFSLVLPSPPPLAAAASGRGVYNFAKGGHGSGQLGQLASFGDEVPGVVLPLQIPPAVKRVGDIFDNPRFFVDGPSAKDIHQGGNGDCWFLSAITALCNLEDTRHLIERVCCARDQDVGVYGFLLYRDGEWTSVIIDDKLFLRSPNYEDADLQTRKMWENNRIRVNSAEEYRQEFQTNSRALYYGQSTHPDETWVPLLEKAFEKRIQIINRLKVKSSRGFVGDGIEDLTGGLSTTIISSNILSRDRFWSEGLMRVNKDFLFGCGTQDWDDPEAKGRDGIIGGHAYSILQAVEYKGERLVLVKNPWGRQEWNGPWSDGSSQWNADAIRDLGHTFGDDGIFWIRYADLLRKYDTMYRTRIFTDDWKVIQQWTGVSVPWAGEYQDTKFEVIINKSSPTVIILSQLDDRYFRGLAGQYGFKLSFRVHRAGEEDYITRTFGEFYNQRSVNAELFLEAGTYEVRVKISAQRDDKVRKVEDIVKGNWLVRREKLLQVGLSYDLAHAKGQVKDSGETNEEPKPVLSRKTTKVTKSTTTTETTETTTTTVEEEEEPKRELLEQDGEVSKSDKPEVKDPEPVGDPPPPGSDSGDAEDGWGAEEPWGAVAVIGLRVFCKDADATIQIIRPVAAAAQKLNLDVDDPAVDAAKGKRVVKPEEMKTGQQKTEKKKDGEKDKKKDGDKDVEKTNEKTNEKKDEDKDEERDEKKDEETMTDDKIDKETDQPKTVGQKEQRDAKSDDWVAVHRQDEETASEKARSEGTQTDDAFTDVFTEVKEEISAKGERPLKTTELEKPAGVV